MKLRFILKIILCLLTAVPFVSFGMALSQGVIHGNLNSSDLSIVLPFVILFILALFGVIFQLKTISYYKANTLFHSKKVKLLYWVMNVLNGIGMLSLGVFILVMKYYDPPAASRLFVVNSVMLFCFGLALWILLEALLLKGKIKIMRNASLQNDIEAISGEISQHES